MNPCHGPVFAHLPFFFDTLQQSLNPALRRALHQFLLVLFRQAAPEDLPRFTDLLRGTLEALPFVGDASHDIIALALALLDSHAPSFPWLAEELAHQLARILSLILKHDEHVFL
jgi:hypothetical protein